MKIGFCALSWLDADGSADPGWFAELKATGYDGLEIPIVRGSIDDYARLGEALDRAELRRTALTVMPPGKNPISSDDSERRAGFAHIAWAIAAAHALGAEMLVGPIHQTLGVFTGEPPSAIELARLAAFHRHAGDVAAEYRIGIAVEPMNRFECHILNRMDALARHLEAVNHPSLGALYDTFHANIEESHPVAALLENAHLIRHVHISESHRGMPGSGHVNWPATFRALKQINYAGWLTVEVFGRAVPAFAAAARVWRDLPEGRTVVCRRSYDHVRVGWENAR